jgi:epoxyqueuosine reductase
MKELVRQRARQLGFDDCRVTTAHPPGSAPQFERWLASGCHGEMAYLERNAPKRIEPQRVLPEARSLITLAASYFEPAPEPQKGQPLDASPPRGLVARYARYRDYHEVLGQRLKQLTEFVNELGGAGTRSLWYVDTGPLLERDLAQRAGLGFIGKHTNLISRRLGNWFFLSEIITTLELEPDAPERNHCGSCTRCLAACPTGAITAPFQLDARRCISYLTIELKGPIPLPLRRAIGHRIYGCDDCLAACPWNRFAREGRLMREHARPELAAPDLLELLALDDHAFRLRFAGTPILRAKRRGLLRNVCVALGNIGDRACLPALEKATRDPEPLIAEHARWAMDEISARTAPARH